MTLSNRHQTTDNVRASELFQAHQLTVYKQTDRLFAILMPIQWLAGIMAAFFVSPYAWSGVESRVHVHVWAAIFLGGAITLLPLALVFRRPGTPLTRNVVAISQMLMTGLLIHLSGGRIETHFHVFGSLAFLAFYRDCRVLIPATLVTALDHLLRGWFYPMSMYGILTGGEWRWIEHACWVIFIDIFLIASCRQSAKEMWDIARRTAEVDASEEQYRAIMEQTQEGIVLIEPETLRIIDCNEAFRQLLGCQSAEEAKTMKVSDFSSIDRNELAQLKKIGEKGAISREKTFYRLDGAIVPVDLSVSFISYNGKQAYCANVKVIAERKQAEAELKRLALVVQKMHNAVVLTDAAGCIEWANQGFTHMTGYDLSEVLGKKPGHVLQGEKTDPHTVAAIRQSLAARQPFEGEIYNYRKDGTGYWLSLSISPIEDENGVLQGYISLEMDISERKTMEEELRRTHDELELRVIERTLEYGCANKSLQLEINERKRADRELGEAQGFLSKVLNSLPNPIFVKDEKGKFRLVNTAFTELYGKPVEELIGKGDTDFHSPEEAQKFIEDDRQVMESQEEKFILEEQHTDFQGNVHWLQTVKRPMVMGENMPRYLLGICTDLTERRELENQLSHAQKMESIGQLAAGIAHEINTPTQYVGDNTRFVRESFSELGGVLGKFTELLASVRGGLVPPELIAQVEKEIEAADVEYLLEEIPHALQQSLEGISRIAHIVQAMKDFSHPGASEKRAADLNKAIASTITVARNEWKYVADLETNFDETLPFVPCLLSEFNQVILNMTINASHAIADVIGEGATSKGKITITTANIADEWAEIRISDTGSGIPPQARSRIFDPFFTTKEVGQGTGQGLAISHNVIVEKHKGQLSFETEMGQGTTFIIRLPLAEPPPHNNQD